MEIDETDGKDGHIYRLKKMGDHTSNKSSRKNSERNDKKLREKSEVLNWVGLKFPVNLSDINKFENHNSSISVNVFGY